MPKTSKDTADDAKCLPYTFKCVLAEKYRIAVTPAGDWQLQVSKDEHFKKYEIVKDDE